MQGLAAGYQLDGKVWFWKALWRVGPCVQMCDCVKAALACAKLAASIGVRLHAQHIARAYAQSTPAPALLPATAPCCLQLHEVSLLSRAKGQLRKAGGDADQLEEAAVKGEEKDDEQKGEPEEGKEGEGGEEDEEVRQPKEIALYLLQAVGRGKA